MRPATSPAAQELHRHDITVEHVAQHTHVSIQLASMVLAGHRTDRHGILNVAAQLIAGTDGDNWQHQAACVGHPVDLWFPDPTDHPANQTALDICWGCPVRVACLQYALTHHIGDGIWGGRTEKQRRRIRRGRRGEGAKS